MRLHSLERFEDRARPLATGGAARAEAFEGGARRLELGDSGVERREPLAGQLPHPRAVVGPVEGEQLADLLEGESRRLGTTHETEAAQVLGPVAADAAGARRHRE